jgi:hypothetical protein
MPVMDVLAETRETLGRILNRDQVGSRVDRGTLCQFITTWENFVHVHAPHWSSSNTITRYGHLYKPRSNRTSNASLMRCGLDARSCW